MSKFWKVVVQEYRRNVFRKGFLFGLFSVPLLITVVALVSVVLSYVGGQDEGAVGIGYIDRAGVIANPMPRLQEDDPEDAVRLVAFETDELASNALSAGQVKAYFVLVEDYRETRRVEVVSLEELDARTVHGFQTFLQANLLDGQPPEIVQRAVIGSYPILRSPDGRLEFAGKLTPGDFLLPLSGLAFVILIFSSSGYLTQAVVEEKANRTMEILATSLSPWQLMGGKLTGIVAVTLTQFAGWLASAALVVFVGGGLLDVAWLQNLAVEPRAAFLMVALLLPAYVLVAALMMTVGIALADARGSQQVVVIFVSLYMVPLGFMLPVLSHPNSPLATALSLFPFTAPIMLPLRYSLVLVPFWQVLASVAIQAFLAMGALGLAVRTYRLGMLRFGKRLHWQEMLGIGEVRSAARRHDASKGRSGAGPKVRERVAVSKRRMHKTLLVLRYELVRAVTRPMYLVMMVGLPVFLYVNVLVMQAAQPGRPSTRYEAGGMGEVVVAPALPEPETQGYVDHSGLIQMIPENVPAGTLIAYGDETSARQALEDGTISAYHIIPADYVTTGELVTVRPDPNPLSGTRSPDWMQWVLLANLVGGDSAMAGQVWNPMDLVQVSAEPSEGSASTDDESLSEKVLTRWLPAVIMLVLYGVIALMSGTLMSSVSEEKKNRVIEVLLVSVNPRQMLSGKITAQGIAGLLQAGAWMAIGYVLFGLVGAGGDRLAGLELSPALLFWGVVFFLLGYGVYASLMAGAGALMPNVKESPMASLMFYAPAIIGFEISLFSQDNPHGVLPTVTSLFPLTSPFSMMHRLVAGGVPLWQVLLSVGLLLITIPLVVRAVARMFRAQNLLSGQPYSARRYFRMLLRWR